MVSLFSYQQQRPLLPLLKEEKLLLRKILSKIAQGLVGNNLGQGYVFMKKAWNENTHAHTLYGSFPPAGLLHHESAWQFYFCTKSFL